MILPFKLGGMVKILQNLPSSSLFTTGCSGSECRNRAQPNTANSHTVLVFQVSSILWPQEEDALWWLLLLLLLLRQRVSQQEVQNPPHGVVTQNTDIQINDQWLQSCSE